MELSHAGFYNGELLELLEATQIFITANYSKNSKLRRLFTANFANYAKLRRLFYGEFCELRECYAG